MALGQLNQEWEGKSNKFCRGGTLCSMAKTNFNQFWVSFPSTRKISWVQQANIFLLLSFLHIILRQIAIFQKILASENTLPDCNFSKDPCFRKYFARLQFFKRSLLQKVLCQIAIFQKILASYNTLPDCNFSKDPYFRKYFARL